jgi:hypothetical protein
VWPHPLPASPIKGEVGLCAWGAIEFNAPDGTSPLMGRLGGVRVGSDVAVASYNQPLLRRR